MTRTAAKKKAIADAQAKAKVEREAKLAAVVVDFEKNYGRDESKLVAWQMLCTDVGKEAGTSIRQCKKNLKGVYVNIVDFVEAKSSGRTFTRFASFKVLRDYSYGHGKIFPLKKAKGNPLLQGLLVCFRGRRAG